MAQDELRRAIQEMQDGAVDSAVGLLKRLIEDPGLDAKGRAAACVWLAEARDDHDYKRRCLERALEFDPENQQIKQGLQQLVAAPRSPTDLPPMRRSAAVLDPAPPVVGIEGGLNGRASAFFVGRDGLLATTSYVVGGAQEVTVRLDTERQLPGTVQRRIPTVDIALVATDLTLARKPAQAPQAMIAAQAAFVALSYAGARIRGMLRADAASPWLETNIPPAQLPDAGGNPLVDERGQLLGILTRNTGPNGNASALQLSRVMGLAEQLRRDRQLLPRAAYCPACGGLARAAQFGGKTCELCGARLVSAIRHPHQREQLTQLYGAGAGPPCRHCGAQAGHYAGRCLRCGFDLSQKGAG